MFIIFALVLLGAMGFSIVLPSIMFVAEDFGGGEAMAGWIVASYAIGQLIATPIWGRLSDRYGRKLVLAICAASTMVAFLGLAFAYDSLTLFVSRFIGGLAGGLFSVSQAWVADTTTPKNRAKGMGIMGAGISLGFITGPFVGGLLGGESAETASLLLPGLLGAVLAAVLLIVILIFMRESLPPEKRSAPQPLGAELQQWRAVGARPVVKRLLILGLLWMTAAGMFEVMMPLWVGDTLDWGPRHVGVQFLFLGLLVAIVQGLIAGRLSIRFGEVAVIAAGIVLYAVGLLLIAFLGTTPGPDFLRIGTGELADFMRPALAGPGSRLAGRRQRAAGAEHLQSGLKIRVRDGTRHRAGAVSVVQLDGQDHFPADRRHVVPVPGRQRPAVRFGSCSGPLSGGAADMVWRLAGAAAQGGWSMSDSPVTITRHFVSIRGEYGDRQVHYRRAGDGTVAGAAAPVAAVVAGIRGADEGMGQAIHRHRTGHAGLWGIGSRRRRRPHNGGFRRLRGRVHSRPWHSKDRPLRLSYRCRHGGRDGSQASRTW